MGKTYKIPKRMCKLISAVIIALSLFLMPFGALADSAGTCQVTLKFVDGSVAVSGAEFSIYQFAGITDYSGDRVSAELLGTFASSGVSQEELNSISDASGWTKIASRLSEFVMGEGSGVSATATATTDGEGSAAISLSSGYLYLVVGSSVKLGSTTYTPTPYILIVTASDSTISSEVKYDKKTESSPGGGGSSGGGGGTGEHGYDPDPDSDTSPDTSWEETPITDETLPQTGTLNWPIPVLAGLGLFLIGAGCYVMRED